MAESIDVYYRKTRDHRASWKELGVLLHLKMPDLKAIEKDNLKDTNDCLLDMLNFWLQSNPECPDEELDDAIRELCIGSQDHEAICQNHPCIQEMSKLQKELAACRELVEKACGQLSNHTDEDTSRNHTEVEIMGNPTDGEITSSKLKRDFADIVVSVCRWLRNRYPEAENAVVWLNEILKDFQSEPLAAQNEHSAIFEQLQKRWSFTNTGALQQLVRETINQELINNMDIYQFELNNLCHLVIESNRALKKKVILEPYDANMHSLILKITAVLLFNDIEVFLKNAFGTYKHYLRIHKIEPGCVTLQFDGRIKPQIQACISRNHKIQLYAEMKIQAPKPKQHMPQEKQTTKPFLHTRRAMLPINNWSQHHTERHGRRKAGPQSLSQIVPLKVQRCRLQNRKPDIQSRRKK